LLCTDTATNYKKFAKLKGVQHEMKVCIITTASPHKENNKYAQKAKEDFKKMGFQNIHFLDLEFESLECLTVYLHSFY